jgi:hypothetical protein
MVEELLSQTEGVAQVVESLLCKHKALNSNPVPPKRKKKKKPSHRWGSIFKGSNSAGFADEVLQEIMIHFCKA